MLIGYARVSTDAQDVSAQQNELGLAVAPGRVYVDEGRTATYRDRPTSRCRLPPAACRRGDTFVVNKLDRLARSLPEARDILTELVEAGVRLSLGGAIHDPTDPMGRLLFNVLGMVAEFEADLMRARAVRNGRPMGERPALRAEQGCLRGFPWPVLGRVEHDASGGRCDPGWGW